MTVISKRFADELSEKEMRDAYLSAQTRTKLTNQIRAIRSLRGWSQGEFAKILGKPQSNVSRLENREYGSFTLNTLFELASAFDVGLVVEFVQYDDFLRRTHDLSPSHLHVGRFSRTSLEPLCRNGVATDHLTAVVTATAGISPQLECVVHQVPIGQGTNFPIGHAPQGGASLSFVTTGASGASVMAAAGSVDNATTINAGFSGGSPVIALNQLGSGVQPVAFGD